MFVLASLLLWAGIAFVVVYLVLRLNPLWIYTLLDRARQNDLEVLPESYELPRFIKKDKRGGIDLSAKWSGWDGWYFFMLPEDSKLPAKMIRCSLMTGLYGLEGVDNYDKVSLRLDNSQEVEFMCLVPTEEVFQERSQAFSHLSHHYLPKATDLKLKADELDVSIRGLKVQSDEETVQFGRIQGRWPNYRFRFIHPESEISLTLEYQGKDILWWADIPGIFTYFAAFGAFRGEICFQRGNIHSEPHQIPISRRTYPISGYGCFEHGFARKPFDFDPLWSPFRFLKQLAPSLKFLRYHYELFIDSRLCHGGFMLARGFGIDFRNRGGVFWNGGYTEIRDIQVEYPPDIEGDQVDDCAGTAVTSFPRQWRVRAETDEGTMEYTAVRSFPPALVASNLTYYHFSFEGQLHGQAISGKGYGEYARI